MTMAVCFRCGGLKFGAFTACPACMHRPRNDDELAQSLALSDHNLDSDALDRMSERIRSGESVPVDPTLRLQMFRALDGEPGVRGWLDMANSPREKYPPAIDVVRDFWRLMNTNDFGRVAEVLSEKFVLEWPQSRERIRGAERFARMNAEYPGAGPWSFTINRIVGAKDTAVTVVTVTDGVTTAVAVSFFIVREGKITKLIEYWPEPYPAPAHRSHLVEPLE